MSKHIAHHERDYGLPLAALALIFAMLVALGWAKVESNAAPVVPEQFASITAPAVVLDHDKTSVTTTAAPVQAAPQPAPLSKYPIPPCPAYMDPPAGPPCHWDSGQYGGPESYVWTGEYKIVLVEPRP